MSAWTNLVKSVYNKNKGKAGYSLGDAMKEASRLKKSGKAGMPNNSTKKSRHQKKRGRKSCKRR